MEEMLLVTAVRTQAERMVLSSLASPSPKEGSVHLRNISCGRGI